MRRLLIISALALMPLSSLIGGLLYLIWWLLPYHAPHRPMPAMPARQRAQPAAGSEDLPFELPGQPRQRQHSFRLRPRLRHGLGLFVILSALTLLSCAQPLWQLAGWLSRYLLPALLIFGTYKALLSGRLKVPELLTGLLTGSLLLAGVGLINYAFDWQTHPQLFCFSAYGGFCLLDLLLLAEDRARSFSMHPNVLGALLMLSLPLWLWLLGVSKGLRKLFVLGGLMLVTLTLLLSFSRASWLGAALIGMLGSFWLLSASWRQGLWLSGGLGLGVMALTGRLQNVFGRLTELGAEQGSHLSRLMLWEGGLRMLMDHVWLGTGLLQIEPLLARYLPPVPGGAGHLHNWYLQVAVESGLPAALVLFSCLGILLGKPGQLPPLGRACWLAWAAMFLSCLFDVTLLDLRIALMLCLLLGLLMHQRRLQQQLKAVIV